MVLSIMIGRWRHYDVKDTVPLLDWNQRAIVSVLAHEPDFLVK